MKEKARKHEKRQVYSIANRHMGRGECTIKHAHLDDEARCLERKPPLLDSLLSRSFA